MTKHHSRDHDDDREEVTEQTPLVRNNQETSPPSSSGHPQRPRALSSVASIVGSVHVPKAHSPNTIVAIICVILIVTTCANGFQAIPIMRIFEDILCHQHYGVQNREVPIDEELCKDDAIQARLANLTAVSSVLSAIAGCLSAMPWAFVADKIGRRPVLAIGLVATALGEAWVIVVTWFGLPIELVWLESLASLIGGNAVFSAIFSSMLSDILPESERALGFMRLHVASMLGSLGSPTIASVLMPRIGPWALLFMAIGCIVFSAFAFLFVPETRPQPKSLDSDAEEPPTFAALLAHKFTEMKKLLSTLNNSSFILLLLTTLSYMTVVSSTMSFLSQFTSKRYRIRLAETGYIQSSYGLAHLLVVLLVIPYLSHLVMKPTSPRFIRMRDGNERDLVFARWSNIALALGALAMALSPALSGFIGGLVIMSLGSGAGSFVKSTMSLFIGPEHRTRMFSLVGIIEYAGSFYAMPLLAGLFTLGMRLGDTWMGLPYIGVTVLCVMVLTMLLFVRIPATAENSDDEASVHSDSDSGSGESES